MLDFNTEKKDFCNNFNKFLEGLLTPYRARYPDSSEIIDAVIYSTITSGGKRLRPMLVYGAARSQGVDFKQIAHAAAAIELVHCYSLIHDDLPAMDNHDTRRGMQSCHSKFGEANAILAGDIMQVMAFDSINSSTLYSAEVKEIMTQSLIKASCDIVCGQVIDLRGESEQLTLQETEKMHQLKCGALIKTSLQLGALSGGKATDDFITKITSAGEKIGLGFQIKDDLMDMDEEGESSTGVYKSTYPAIAGVEKSRQRIEELREQALNDIGDLSDEANFLRQLFMLMIEMPEDAG